MQKKWIAALLAVCMSLSLVIAGCGGEKKAEKKADEKIIIKNCIWK